MTFTSGKSPWDQKIDHKVYVCNKTYCSSCFNMLKYKIFLRTDFSNGRLQNMKDLFSPGIVMMIVTEEVNASMVYNEKNR